MAAYFRIGGMVILVVGAVYKLISTTCCAKDDPREGMGLVQGDSSDEIVLRDDPGHDFSLKADISREWTPRRGDQDHGFGLQDDDSGGGTVLRHDSGEGLSLHAQDENGYYNDEGYSLLDENEDDGFTLQDDNLSGLLEELIHEAGLSDENFRKDWRSTKAEDACFGTHARSTIEKEVEEVETQSVVMKRIKHYCSTQKILLVGEGNFSFAACLAKAFGSATNMVATSLDSYTFILRNYAPGGWLNLSSLKERGCKVIHKVNAKKMASHFEVGSMTFDIIVYNFPHAGFTNGFESSESQIKRHRSLLRGFFKNAKRMLSNGGEIHVTHKTNGFFAEWRIEELAAQCGLHVIEKTKFRLSDYPGYETKYGFGGNKNFYCHPSITSKFAKMSNRLGPGQSPHLISYDPPDWFLDVDESESMDDDDMDYDDMDYEDELALSFYIQFERNTKKLERRKIVERQSRGATNWTRH